MAANILGLLGELRAMLSSAAIICGGIVGTLTLLDWVITDDQRKRLKGAAETAWIWLSYQQGLPYLEYLRSRRAFRWMVGVMFVLVYAFIFSELIYVDTRIYGGESMLYEGVDILDRISVTLPWQDAVVLITVVTTILLLLFRWLRAMYQWMTAGIKARSFLWRSGLVAMSGLAVFLVLSIAHEVLFTTPIENFMGMGGMGMDIPAPDLNFHMLANMLFVLTCLYLSQWIPVGVFRNCPGHPR